MKRTNTAAAVLFAANIGTNRYNDVVHKNFHYPEPQNTPERSL